MITNTGKNIVAKYLIGDAPAYASYIALGCGPTPRPNISTMSEVSVANISGTVTSDGTPDVGGQYITPITGIGSTAGLLVGMTLTKVSGTGAFGENTTITSIDGPTQITVTSPTGAHTTGALVFKTGGLSQLLSTTSTSGLWINAKVTIVDGVGELNAFVDTKVSAISSDTTFTITPGPTTDLLDSTLFLEIDPNKNALDFEMFRVPVTSKGYVNDSGVNKIILTAQLPTEERYEISEIGLYSAGSNALAGQYDSKTLSAFSADENWQLSLGESLISPGLTEQMFPEYQTSLINGLNFFNTDAPAVKTSSSNGVFANSTRSARYERPRYLSNVFMLKGSTSSIYELDGVLDTYGTPAFLQITGQGADLSRNASSDLLKIAFAIVSVDGNSSEVPDQARIIVEFSNNSGTQHARMEVEAKDSEYRFEGNRYINISKRLDELTYSSGQFSWRTVNVIKIYVATSTNLSVESKQISSNIATLTTTSAHGLLPGEYVKVYNVDEDFDGIRQVISSPTADSFTFALVGDDLLETGVVPNGVAEVPNENFYLALDAIRVDNVSTANPLYGLTGYSIVQNSQQETISKSPNTNNYIEYRFILDVT